MLDSVLIITHTPKFSKKDVAFLEIKNFLKEKSFDVKVEAKLLPLVCPLKKQFVFEDGNFKLKDLEPDISNMLEKNVEAIISDHIIRNNLGNKESKSITIVCLEANLGKPATDIKFDSTFFKRMGDTYPQVRFVLFSGSSEAMINFKENVKDCPNVYQEHIDKVKDTSEALEVNQLEAAFKNILPEEASKLFNESYVDADSKETEEETKMRQNMEEEEKHIKFDTLLTDSENWFNSKTKTKIDLLSNLINGDSDKHSSTKNPFHKNYNPGDNISVDHHDSDESDHHKHKHHGF
jgi:hypothetical protein